MTYVRYENKWPNVKLEMSRDLGVGVRNMSLAVERQIVGNITRPPKGGPPLVDTNNYRNSWNTDIDSDGLAGTIGSPVEYGVYLEYGHYTRKAKANGGKPRSFVLARPHIRQAAESVARRASEYFRGRR